jgi:hypothetical protein
MSLPQLTQGVELDITVGECRPHGIERFSDERIIRVDIYVSKEMNHLVLKDLQLDSRYKTVSLRIKGYQPTITEVYLPEFITAVNHDSSWNGDKDFFVYGDNLDLLCLPSNRDGKFGFKTGIPNPIVCRFAGNERAIFPSCAREIWFSGGLPKYWYSNNQIPAKFFDSSWYYTLDVPRSGSSKCVEQKSCLYNDRKHWEYVYTDLNRTEFVHCDSHLSDHTGIEVIVDHASNSKMDYHYREEIGPNEKNLKVDEEVEEVEVEEVEEEVEEDEMLRTI